jgi:hypothetical protein
MVNECRTQSKKMVKFFPWEELDYVPTIRQAFGL